MDSSVMAAIAAIVRNYTIERGIQWSRDITILEPSGTPIDLTGVIVQADIRISKLPTDISALPAGTGAFVTSFATDLGVDPTKGVLTIGLTTVQTAAIPRGDYDYDVVLVFPSGGKRRILVGVITVVEIASHGQ